MPGVEYFGQIYPAQYYPGSPEAPVVEPDGTPVTALGPAIRGTAWPDIIGTAWGDIRGTPWGDIR